MAYKAIGYKKTDHKVQDKLCPIQILAYKKLCTKLETCPYLYLVVVDLDRRPLARPSQEPKLGCPCKGAVQTDLEPDQDLIDVDTGRENKQKRQSTLLFLVVDMETDPALEQLGSQSLGIFYLYRPRLVQLDTLFGFIETPRESLLCRYRLQVFYQYLVFPIQNSYRALTAWPVHTSQNSRRINQSIRHFQKPARLTERVGRHDILQYSRWMLKGSRDSSNISYAREQLAYVIFENIIQFTHVCLGKKKWSDGISQQSS